MPPPKWMLRAGFPPAPPCTLLPVWEQGVTPPSCSPGAQENPSMWKLHMPKIQGKSEKKNPKEKTSLWKNLRWGPWFVQNSAQHHPVTKWRIAIFNIKCRFGNNKKDVFFPQCFNSGSSSWDYFMVDLCSAAIIFKTRIYRNERCCFVSFF